MVVNEDERRRPGLDRRAEDLPGVDQGSVEDPPRHEDIPEDTMLRVEEDGAELLLKAIPHSRSDPTVDVVRPPDPRAGHSGLNGGPAPQFEGCHDPGSGRLAEPRSSCEPVH
jgi:hypothetical protein